jgi:arginine-tRNA-protein transferase
MIYLNQYTNREQVTPAQLDHLLATGWRHFGTSFFRYSLVIEEDLIQRVIPLRIRLADFFLSRSQRRIVMRNRDLDLVIRPAAIDDQKMAMFQRHKQRFQNNVPDSLHDFLSATPHAVPCRNDELCLYDDGRLLAVSYLDIGQNSASAVYAIFEPDEAARSLGIYLILCGIEYAKRLQLKYYYPGYAYREPSFYDYKKRFQALEVYDWQGQWEPFNPEDA